MPVNMTQDQSVEQLHKLLNHARARFREIKDTPGFPPISEKDWCAAYVIAHKDIMLTMAKGVADVTKRRIYTV